MRSPVSASRLGAGAAGVATGGWASSGSFVVLARRASMACLAALVVSLLRASDAGAIALDKDGNVTLRATLYSQATIATQNSYPETDPPKSAGQLMQHRNFYNPEFDAKLLPMTGWTFLDEFSVRFAYWGFYDGLYDYGPHVYGERAAQIKFRGTVPRLNNLPPQFGIQSKGQDPIEALENRDLRRNVRHIYGERNRVNEAYVNIAKGPLFVRIGKQSISWGESDTIGLIDANNPFDITLFAPGIFQPIDEARIPLWTLRSTVQLFDSWGPFSSGFLDVYVVPGMIDNTVNITPVQSGSPYSSPPPANGQHLFHDLPDWGWGSSRYGARLEAVIAGDYTTSAWYYTTFPIQPMPKIIGIDSLGLITLSLEQELMNVIGASTTFFSQPLNSIVRAQLTLFNGEQAFNAEKALGQAINSGFTRQGSIDRVNVLRGELGVDRNVFIRPLNPYNSFLIASAIVFDSNLDDFGGGTNYRYQFPKASAIRRQLDGGEPAGFVIAGCNESDSPLGCDYVEKDPVEWFLQTHIETDYMHGKLKPSLTAIVNGRGSLMLNPVLDVRWTDAILSQVSYVNIHTFGSINNGYGPPVGLMRDRDQIWFRMTYQIN